MFDWYIVLVLVYCIVSWQVKLPPKEFKKLPDYRLKVAFGMIILAECK